MAQKEQRGFSLIELIIVMGLTGIFLTMGTIGTIGYFMRQSLDTEAKSLVALLRDAQSRSMGQENESRWGVYLYNGPSDERDWYSLFEVNETLLASSSYVGVPGQAVEQKTVKANLEFATPPVSSSTVVVFSKISGNPTASTSVVLNLRSDVAAQKTILISGNGRIDYQ